MDVVFPEYKPFTTKVIFYRIPKNASTSIYNHLGAKNIINLCEKDLYQKVDQRIYKNTFYPSHVKPEELENLILGNLINDYFSFCVIRNPWDRAVSMYKFAIKMGFKNVYNIDVEDTFENFCSVLKENKDNPFFIGSHKQCDWLKGNCPPKKIIYFENLQQEFSEMVEELNLIGVSPILPHENKTEHSHYSLYYNDSTKQIIKDVFEEDVDRFKYTFSDQTHNKQRSKDKGHLKM